MRLFLKQNTDGGKTLFTVSDELGRLVYTVAGDSNTIGGKFYLLDNKKIPVARISRLGTTTLSRYAVYIDGQERATVIQNFAAPRQPYRLRGITWQFRGDPMTRSFDLVCLDSTLIMSHGRCWGICGDCFAIDVLKEEDVILSLCISVAVDNTITGGAVSALPIG